MGPRAAIAMKRRTGTFIVVAGLLLAAAGLAGWRLTRPVAVETATVAPGTLPAQVGGTGTVQARVPLTVSARLTSTVVGVEVDVGDEVRRGQVLVRLDGRDLAARRAAVLSQQESIARQVEAGDAAVAKARAELDLALSRQRRDADLHTKGFVSFASLDASTASARAATAALDSAQATVAARRADQQALRQEAVVAETQVGHTLLLAPMSGIVTHRLAEPGTTVAPGTPLLRIVDPRTLWVATRIDEALVERVQPGQPATIRLRSGTTVRGRVERIALQSDAATRELDVHVAFEAVPPRVAIDQEAEVRIETGRDRGLVVPLAALVRDESGRRGVLQVAHGRTRFVGVQTGTASGEFVLVREGLGEGDVVVADASGARPGMRVRPPSR